MTFSFRSKSFQHKKDDQKELRMINKVSGPAGTPVTVKYITKANIDTINERGADDLTGASYVSELTSPTVGNAVCLGVVYGGQLALNAAVPGAGTAAKTVWGGSVGFICNQTLGAAVDNAIDFLQEDHASENQGDPMAHGSMGIEEADDYGHGGANDTDTDTDTSPQNDTNNDDGSDGDSDEGGIWDAVVDAWNSFWGNDEDTDADAGGDGGNPNPYADGSQGSTSKPTIGPAPGDIGGRYNDMFNPGAERGFTPGDDGGDGNPGNPWDRNERMSTPNDNGDPIDPLTGFGGPSGPQVDDGNPIDPDEDYNSSGPGDDLWKPNPDDIWGGGPTSKIVGSIQIEDDKSMVFFVTSMSAETVMA